MSKIDFQPVSKRFIVWDKVEKKFTPPLEMWQVVVEFMGGKISGIMGDKDKKRYAICQSTNLFDRDGKEIFEGSIVELNGVKFLVTQTKYEWEAKSVICRLSFRLDKVERAYNAPMKVIGHILSNPELLEQGVCKNE